VRGDLARFAWLPGAALLSLLPHLGAVVPRAAYYFRDFTVTFYPQRWLWATELRAGRLAFWNPYVLEGSFLLPVFYPLDLLHAFWPGPAAVSWLLTLHFPLAALTAYALAADLGLGRPGRLAASVVFSMGGLALSSLNLYVFLQALALCPLVVLLLRRAAARGGAWVAAAAAGLAVAVTTMAVEFVAQACLLGGALGLAEPGGRRRVPRLLAAGVLGVGLAAVPVCTTVALLRESVRGTGFPAEVALANELHPAGLLQVLVPNAFGALAAPAEAWWGGRFFTKGFPYFLSLYVGPLALSLAAAGLREGPRRERVLLLAAAVLGLWYALGARAGLASLALRVVPGMSSFRFPSKALLLTFLVVSLLAGRGADALARGERWGVLRTALLACAGVAAALGGLLVAAPGAFEASTGVSWDAGALPFRLVGTDCIWMAGVSLLGIAIGALVQRGRLPASRAAVFLVLLLATDLARAGAGMNPQTAPGFFAPLPELARLGLDRLEGGRVFTYGLDASPAVRSFIGQGRPGIGLWSFFVSRQVEAPYANVLDRVELAEGKDVTSFVPQAPALTLEDYDPRGVGRILGRLREASVVRVLSLDPLSDPALHLLARWESGVAGLDIHAYTLDGGAPRDGVACPAPPGMPAPACRGSARRTVAEPGRIEVEVEAERPALLLMRDSYASGWKASVDGRPAAVERVLGRYRGVAVPAGRSRVALRYETPGLRTGVWLTAIALAAALWVGTRTRTDPPGAAA
jgi:hypothetical protein